MVTHLRVTERHLPYGVTQSYLPPDTGERAPQPDRQVLDLPTLEGWKAELTLMIGYIMPRWFIRPQTVIHPSSNHLIAIRPLTGS